MQFYCQGHVGKTCQVVEVEHLVPSSNALCFFATSFGQKRLSRKKLHRFFLGKLFGPPEKVVETGNSSLPELQPYDFLCIHFPNFNLNLIWCAFPTVLQVTKNATELNLSFSPPCLLRPWFRSYRSALWCGCASSVSLLSSRYVLGEWSMGGFGVGKCCKMFWASFFFLNASFDWE